MRSSNRIPCSSLDWHIFAAVHSPSKVLWVLHVVEHLSRGSSLPQVVVVLLLCEMKWQSELASHGRSCSWPYGWQLGLKQRSRHLISYPRRLARLQPSPGLFSLDSIPIGTRHTKPPIDICFPTKSWKPKTSWSARLWRLSQTECESGKWKTTPRL